MLCRDGTWSQMLGLQITLATVVSATLRDIYGLFVSAEGCVILSVVKLEFALLLVAGEPLVVSDF